MNFEPMNTEVASDVTVRGTKYKKNMFVLISDFDEGLVAGKINSHSSGCVFLVTKNILLLRNIRLFAFQKMGVYRITPAERTCCVNLRNMLDYYILLEYTVCGMSVLILHHSFLISVPLFSIFCRPMSIWFEKVERIILQALPSLSFDILQQIVFSLQSSGLQCKDYQINFSQLS